MTAPGPSRPSHDCPPTPEPDPGPTPPAPASPFAWVFLNGEFVPPDQAVVSVFDRGFLYGDGLFETIRVYRATPFLWREHLQRLDRGAAFLGLRLPFAPDHLTQAAAELLRRNAVSEALLRITVSRGVGPRGYSPQGAHRPFLTMTLHPIPHPEEETPRRWRIVTSSFRLPAGDQLAAHKTSSKIVQVLARREAEELGADEALLLTTDGLVAEAASSNVFWVQHKTISTPPVAAGILPGVTRALVLHLCARAGFRCAERAARPNVLRHANALFLTLSTFGIVEAAALDGHHFQPSPVIDQLQHAYRQEVRRATGP